MRLRAADAFAFINGVLFAGFVGAAQIRRLIAYSGPANLEEFLLYAVAIATMVMVAWTFLRRVNYPGWLLALVQLGILAHFAGAFVVFDGGRLYDSRWLGLGFDKFVHVYNSFIVAAVLTVLFERLGIVFAFRWVAVAVLTLGAGAGQEIVEYLVSQVVPHTGVGGYDNNMRDLIADLAGALAWTSLHGALRRRFAPISIPGSQEV